MDEVPRKEGRTVLFVSHNLQAVRNLCVRAIVMEAGGKRFDGKTGPALDVYLGRGIESDARVYETANSPRRMPGSDLARIERVWFTSNNSRFRFADPFQIQVQLVASEGLSDACFDLTFFNLDNNPVGTSFSPNAGVRTGRAVYQLTIPSLRFAPGRYYCDLALLKGNWLQSPSLHDVVTGILQFEVDFPKCESGAVPVWYPNWGAAVPEEITVFEVLPAKALE